MNKRYIYIYLNPIVEGNWTYKEHSFSYKPFYVGIGVDKRWKVHLNLNREKHENNTFKYDILKLIESNNLKPIIFKLYENLDSEIAKLLEIDIISHFGRIINNSGILANITIGGDNTLANCTGKDNIHSKKVYQYSLDGNFIKEWDCGLREVGRILNLNYNTIADNCRNDTKTAYNFYWSYKYEGLIRSKVRARNKSSLKKKVFVYDLEDNFVDSFDSVTECANHYKIGKCLVSQNCRLGGIWNKKYKFVFNCNQGLKEF